MIIEWEDIDPLFDAYELFKKKGTLICEDLITIASHYITDRTWYRQAELDIGTFVVIYNAVKQCKPEDCHSEQLLPITLDIYSIMNAEKIDPYTASKKHYETTAVEATIEQPLKAIGSAV